LQVQTGLSRRLGTLEDSLSVLGRGSVRSSEDCRPSSQLSAISRSNSASVSRTHLPIRMGFNLPVLVYPLTVRDEMDSGSAVVLTLDRLFILFFSFKFLSLTSVFARGNFVPWNTGAVCEYNILPRIQCMITKNYAFSSADVTQLVGITPINLNALVHRQLYGIAASISARHGEIKVRIFSEEDVLGVALVWVLVESGLRTQSIRDVLCQLVETDNAKAAAELLALDEVDYLGIVREPSNPKRKTTPKLQVRPTLKENLNELVTECVAKYPTASILLVPVGQKFADVKQKIDLKYGE
jgi:hypothetical protein